MQRWGFILCMGLGVLFLQTGSGAVPPPGSQVKPQNEVEAQAGQHNNEGVQLAEQGRHREAIRAFQKAVALSPSFASAHYNLGLSYNSLQQFKESSQAFRAAVQAQPNYGDAWHQLGIVLQAQNQFEAASKAYELALSLMPNSPNLLYRLGYVFLNLQNWAQAAFYWEQLQDGYPDHPASLSLQQHLPHLYFNLGTVLYGAGDLSGAEKALDRAVRSQPGYGEALYNLGLVYMAQEHYDRALKILRDARSVQPRNLDVILSLSRAYVLSDSLAKADQVLQNALKEWPGQVSVYQNLADIQLRLGHIPQAVAHALTAVLHAPENPTGFKLLAHIYEHNTQGERYGPGFDSEKAIRAYQRALILDATDVATHFNLGVLYGRLGNWADSWKAFKKAEAIDPQYPGVVKWLPEVEKRYRENKGQ